MKAEQAPDCGRKGRGVLGLLPLLWMVLLCLGGCQAARRENPSPPPVIEMSSPSPEDSDIAFPLGGRWPEGPDEGPDCESTSGTAADSLPVSDPSGSGQPGDTTPTWQPALAADYPSDADCTDQQLLEKWLAVEGLTETDLEALGCWQLILVSAQPGEEPNRTLTVCYERVQDGGFAPAEGLTRMEGYVGKNGIRHDRRRNTNTSPAGLWPLGFAFGNEEPPKGLKLPWRQVDPDSDWVCDEDSRFFNTWQERGDPMVPEGWSEDVEHLEDYPKQYAFACVIGFNRPPETVPDRGCAIFLHCSEGPTGGCVGLSREDMLSVLNWLNGEKQPYILITGAEAASDP